VLSNAEIIKLSDPSPLYATYTQRVDGVIDLVKSNAVVDDGKGEGG
jgi:hypothetical protein